MPKVHLKLVQNNLEKLEINRVNKMGKVGKSKSWKRVKKISRDLIEVGTAIGIIKEIIKHLLELMSIS